MSTSTHLRQAVEVIGTEDLRGDGTTARSRSVQRWRRWRWPLVLGAALLVTALLAALAIPRAGLGRLDPDSAAPDGARALAQVLERQGVAVEPVRRTDDAVAAAQAGATLLVVRPGVLTPDQLDRLAGTAADLVLVEPDALTLSRLAPSLEPAGTVDADVAEPGCEAADAVAAGAALGGGRLFRDVEPGPVLCYAAPGEERAPYAVVQADGRRVTVLGQSQILTNAEVADEGNAALALRTLGRTPQLVWYIAVPELSADAEPTLTDLLPRWVPWLAAQLVVVLAFVVLWRSRRLGRLVPEPLPVVVRAAETTEGRGRLYRRGGSRGRAAATLRAASMRRLAGRCGLPRSATAPEVVQAAAQSSGRSGTDVHSLLLGTEPRDDRELVLLADALDTLEKEVRRP